MLVEKDVAGGTAVAKDLEDILRLKNGPQVVGALLEAQVRTQLYQVKNVHSTLGRQTDKADFAKATEELPLKTHAKLILLGQPTNTGSKQFGVSYHVILVWKTEVGWRGLVCPSMLADGLELQIQAVPELFPLHVLYILPRHRNEFGTAWLAFQKFALGRVLKLYLLQQLGNFQRV